MSQSSRIIDLAKTDSLQRGSFAKIPHRKCEFNPLCWFCRVAELAEMTSQRTHIDLIDSDDPVVTRGAGGKAPAHLGAFIDDEAGVEDCEGHEMASVCNWCQLNVCRCDYDIDAPRSEEDDLLEDEDEGPEEIATRGRKFKRELDRSLQCDEEYEDGNPDLAAYFEQYNLTEQQQIAMCRTYANYLSQKVRSRLRGTSSTSQGGQRYSSGKTTGGRKWKSAKRVLHLEDDQE